MNVLAPDIEIFGSVEAAEYLGIPRESFRTRLYQGRTGTGKPMPEPMWQLACGPIWTKEQLDEWRESQAPLDP